MPLIKSTTDKARSQNIATEVQSGKPLKQAVAIGYAVQRRAEKKPGRDTKRDNRSR